MLSKQQFSELIKKNYMWPGYDWYLKSTSNGLESASNEYINNTIEIIIEYLYQKYIYIQLFSNIFDLNKTDTDKEIIGIKSTNHQLSPGDVIRIYGTLNYNGEYPVLNSPLSIPHFQKWESISDYIFIGNTYIQETISDSCYYTIVSPDKYTESNPYYFDNNFSVVRCNDISDPIYLPSIGYKVGYLYDPSLTISENRRFIKSVIDIYRIKGSILSIKRVMGLLGYSCEIFEPFKSILKYGRSRYDFTHHYQDWRYYHEGVFEVITDGISIDKYKNQISSLVQPVGTRMVARSNLDLGLLPFLGDIETEYSHSYFTELLVKIYKSGNIFDSISTQRTRSGNVDLHGLYADIGLEIGNVPNYRKVWDSQIFSLSDLSIPIIIVNPARRFSQTQGSFSSDTSNVTGWESPYDETSRFDLQLDIQLNIKNERPAMRSEFAKRSGDFAMSGLDGNSWSWKPYYLIHYENPIQAIPEGGIENPIDAIINLDGYAEYPTYSGNILSDNKNFSGRRNIYGIEIITGYRFLTLEDWENKLYWMWDDVSIIIDFSYECQCLDQVTDIVVDPEIISFYPTDKTRSSIFYFSGKFICYDIEIVISN